MYRDARISNYQLFTILTCFLLGSTVIISPVTAAKHDAWLAFLISLFGGFILMMIYVSIANLHPSKTLTEILKSVFGNVVGTIISVLYIWYFIHLAALVLRNFGEYFVVVSYTETPILFIILCFAIVVVYAVKIGIEVIGRISEVFIFLLVLSVVFVFFALMSIFDVENLKPFLSEGFTPILKTAFSVLTFPFGETVVFLMIFPFVNKKKQLYKPTMLSLVIFGFIIFNMVLRNIMVLGDDMASRDIFPSHIVFRLIPGMDLDPLLDINLVIAGMIKITICIYGAVTGITELLGLRSYKAFVIPIVSFIVPLSIWVYDSLMEMIAWATDVCPIYSIPFQIIIPIIILVISLIMNKKTTHKSP